LLTIHPVHFYHLPPFVFSFCFDHARALTAMFVFINHQLKSVGHRDNTGLCVPSVLFCPPVKSFAIEHYKFNKSSPHRGFKLTNN
jgi:hypothetical protein